MNHPAPVEITYKNMRFPIAHNPNNVTLNKFIEDWPFGDSAPLSNQIVADRLNFIKIKFHEEPGCCIAVHCIVGLGRTPVLVALALIEGGMKHEDAIQFIGEKQHGAFKSKQLLYLEKYHPKMRLHFKDSNGHINNCCIQ
nr:protein tyrosine phosphatase type IVA 1-like isoform X3 [Chlorocebus sabaeus]